MIIILLVSRMYIFDVYLKIKRIFCMFLENSPWVCADFEQYLEPTIWLYVDRQKGRDGGHRLITVHFFKERIML